MLRHMVVISYQKFLVSLLLNLFMQKKIPDFSKLPIMLKGTLDHLNSISESDASRCTAAETAISNLETEHGITIKGSRGTNSTEITSFVSSTVSSTIGFSLP